LGKQERRRRQRAYLGVDEARGHGPAAAARCRGGWRRLRGQRRWRRNGECRVRGPGARASGGGGVESARGPGARGPEARAGSGWQKGKGVQEWSMWMSRPLGHALHSLSLLCGKRFLGVSIGRNFPFGCAGPTDEHCPLFLGLCVVISLAPRGFAAPFFIAFRAKSFRPHGTSRLFFFSARAAHLVRRGGRARRSCRA
jgi:hypothetical protein